MLQTFISYHPEKHPKAKIYWPTDAAVISQMEQIEKYFNNQLVDSTAKTLND